MVKNHRIIVVLFPILVFFSSCKQQVRIRANQIDSVVVYGMARGVEFSRRMDSMEDVIRNGRDTMITDNSFIESLAREINNLQYESRSQSIDYRTALVINLSDESSKFLMLGENYGIQYDGCHMSEQESLFSLINKYIYEPHDNSYWLDDSSRSIVRITNNAKTKAKIVFEQIQRIQQEDSLLLALLPSDYTEYLCLCTEYDVLRSQTDTNKHFDSEVLLSRLFTSDLIDYNLFIKKMTDLSASAYLPSSMAGFVLQQRMRTLLKTHLRSIIFHLNNKSSIENKQFWNFIFYGLDSANVEEESSSIRNRIIKEDIIYRYEITT